MLCVCQGTSVCVCACVSQIGNLCCVSGNLCVRVVRDLCCVCMSGNLCVCVCVSGIGNLCVCQGSGPLCLCMCETGDLCSAYVREPVMCRDWGPVLSVSVRELVLCVCQGSGTCVCMCMCVRDWEPVLCV